MITRLHARRFKSWKDTKVLQLAPLTGFFGTNSSGKTSLIQTLLLLKQTVESADRKRVVNTGDNSSLIQLGTPFDLIYGHRVGSVQLSVDWGLPQPLEITDPASEEHELFKIDSLSFSTRIHVDQQRTTVDSFKYEFSGRCFGLKRQHDKGNPGKDRYDLVSKGYDPKRIQGRPWPLPAPVKCYGFPDEATGYYQNTGFLPDFTLALENLFSQMSYLGPLREYPRPRYVWAGERPTDVGRRGEHAVAALLAARAEEMKSGRGVGKRRRYKPIEQRIAEWLSKMDLIQSFKLMPIAKNRQEYEVRVKKMRTSTEVLITDVGFGVSQILPVLVLCYYAPEKSTIILEQPEIHLHPSVQADLADVLIDVVKERNVQVIVESHSEHLLRRLQRRIAEAAITADMTALYFCRTTDSASIADRLNVDEDGNITNWPIGFFGDELGELAAMTAAAMKRQEATQSNARHRC